MSDYTDRFPTKITEAEWKKVPKDKQRRTPLTNLRQHFFTNKDNPEGFWTTETINFIILDKEGLSHGNNVND